jgi:hypothetical protein
MYAGPWFTLVRRSKLVLSAAESIGVPSTNFTLGRNVKVYFLPSADFSHFVASNGSMSFVGGSCWYRTRPS